MSLLRVNLGCGRTPTPGWLNLDNSPTVRLARYPGLVSALRGARLLNSEQVAFARTVKANDIRWGTAGSLPLADGSASVLYSSHMLEHLTHEQVRAFFGEARRVLARGGLLRLVVPDLRKLAREYAETGDSDRFVARTLLADAPRGPLGMLRAMVLGPRHHAWMYDGASLRRLLSDEGFVGAVELQPGQTTIADPGELDLWERAEESVYVEAGKPG